MFKNYLKKSTLPLSVIALSLGLSACSHIQKNYNAKQAQFQIDKTKAIHNANEVVGDLLTIITPKDAILEDHLLLGNRAFVVTEPGGQKKRYTYFSKTTEASEGKAGTFSFSKVKCPKQRSNPYLAKGESIDSTTLCLMNEGDSFPDFGLTVDYDGVYDVVHGDKTDTHVIRMTKAQSIHTVTPNVFSGSIVVDQDDMASESDFYSLLKRYDDDAITVKFLDYSTNELQSAILRHSRRLTKNEREYIDAVKKLFKGESLSFGYPLILRDADPMDGFITFSIKIEHYKNNGSILTLTPYYYPTAREMGNGKQNTVNFATKRDKILEMITLIKND